jgi:hypothetical protein
MFKLHFIYCLISTFLFNESKTNYRGASRNDLSWLKGWHIIMLNKDKTFTIFLFIPCNFFVYLFEVFQSVFHVALLDMQFH